MKLLRRWRLVVTIWSSEALLMCCAPQLNFPLGSILSPHRQRASTVKTLRASSRDAKKRCFTTKCNAFLVYRKDRRYFSRSPGQRSIHLISMGDHAVNFWRKRLNVRRIFLNGCLPHREALQLEFCIEHKRDKWGFCTVVCGICTRPGRPGWGFRKSPTGSRWAETSSGYDVPTYSFFPPRETILDFCIGTGSATKDCRLVPKHFKCFWIRSTLILSFQSNAFYFKFVSAQSSQC